MFTRVHDSTETGQMINKTLLRTKMFYKILWGKCMGITKIYTFYKIDPTTLL